MRNLWAIKEQKYNNENNQNTTKTESWDAFATMCAHIGDWIIKFILLT